MRKPRDGESTKAAVIAAARAVFAEKGFAGTSLAMISQRSGISDGLILHHFKSKQNLYQVVLEDLAGEYAQTVAQAAQGSASPEQAALDMLRAVLDYWSKDATYNRVALWAYLENQPGLVNEEARLTSYLADAIQRMQAAGMIDARFSPVVLLTLAIGPIHFWTRYRTSFQKTLGPQASLDELDQTFRAQFVDLIQKAYRPVSEKKDEGNS